MRQSGTSGVGFHLLQPFLCRTNGMFCFRRYLTAAPVSVIKTLLQHEVIHALLSPHFFPEPGFEPPLQIDFSQITTHHAEIVAIASDTNKTKEFIYDREEALVEKINQEWGADEAEAHRWIERHKPKVRS